MSSRPWLSGSGSSSGFSANRGSPFPWRTKSIQIKPPPMNNTVQPVSITASPPAKIPAVTIQVGGQTITARGILTPNSLSAQLIGLTMAVNVPAGYYLDDATTHATRQQYINALAAFQAQGSQ
jgi:hypothetical protein